MAETYGQWVSRLQARVTRLHEQSAGFNVQKLLKEKESCESFLQTLYDYAERHDIDLVPYYHQLADIQFRLKRLEADAGKQSKGPAAVRRVRHEAAARFRPWGCLARLLNRRAGNRGAAGSSNATLTPRRRKPYD
jgi:hypothetical protein